MPYRLFTATDDFKNSITIIGQMQKGEKWVAFVTTRLIRKR
jgi:hypothetical protein